MVRGPPRGEPVGMNSTSPLSRSRSDSYIGGVCGGLAEHFAIDPALVRVGFAVSILFSGAGLLAYLILLAIVTADEPVAACPPADAAARAGAAIRRTAALRPRPRSAAHPRAPDALHAGAARPRIG